MVQLQLNSDESIEKAISQFKKMVAKEGIILETKKRQYFVKPSALKHERNKSLQRKKLIKLKKAVNNRDSK
ncbi:30S ribosomal protein S21 [Thiospirochaeta perfilievii]|uniref:Small ribosomal subunit protein bS21 n=1 Tax=Thiospirochaeta perfilievii TaxID=252967 RepID=A0A5C1QCP2_9SPIO|nr:30S ribosomal protein S21 [Thiospirochaeta perfilievii]QEN04454.1 30S ribosomal protein S21 [Thiospirochaeta perfilievii]